HISAYHTYINHPHLPPLPTRRSSDLAPKPPQQTTSDNKHQQQRRKVAVLPRQLGHIPRALLWVKVHAVHACNPRQGDKNRGDNGDRKSTRLNSSHVSISYAVFCLKKK